MRSTILLLIISLFPISAEAQTKNQPLPLHIRTANAADQVAALDIAVARQIESDASKGQFTQDDIKDMLEAAKVRYDYSSAITKLAGSLRAFPKAQAASKHSPEFKEIRLGVARVLNAESEMIDTGRDSYSTKLLNLMTKAFEARKELACLLFSL